MSYFDNIKFPYFNMQQLNLDWIMSKIKGIMGFLPDDGTVGQILRRTADGAEWSDEATPVVPVTSVNNKTGAVIVPYTNPNLLENWYFVGGGSQLGVGRFPINQKGQTSYTGAGISVDRWHNDNLSSIQIHADGVGFYGTGSISDAFQILSNNELHGKTLTASVWDSTNHLTIGTTTFPDKPASGWTYKNIISADSFNIVLGAKSDGESRVFIQAKNSASIVIRAIKLEIGSEQTLVHTENGFLVLNEMPQFDTQLAIAQKHYISVSNAEYFFHTSGDNTEFYVFIPNVTNIPNATVTNASCNLARGYGTGYVQTGFTYSAVFTNTQHIILTFQTSTALTSVVGYARVSCEISG